MPAADHSRHRTRAPSDATIVCACRVPLRSRMPPSLERPSGICSPSADVDILAIERGKRLHFVVGHGPCDPADSIRQDFWLTRVLRKDEYGRAVLGVERGEADAPRPSRRLGYGRIPA